MAASNTKKRTIYVGGLTEEVDEKVLRAAFIPFGDISEVQLPLDYETQKHRGFAFVDFELPEDAQAAIDNMHESELFGRVLRVNLAKAMRLKENSTQPVWADDEWLQEYSGKHTLEQQNKADPADPGVNAAKAENESKEAAVKRSANDAIEAAGVSA